MIDYVVSNKEWIFSGVGVVFLGFLFKNILKKLFIKKDKLQQANNHKIIKNNFTQKAGDNSQNIMGNNVKITNKKENEDI
ncbi:hypothetical protein CN689_22395 [Peribacillus butanolivorans]|uniref:Uncharacterized protein n=1 Tax=Peribacillus butanolivorans TaxID=421767 RepID=A0AAX0RXB2_9BACI|nr:hypothetical protein [Peribacillus butanolivorans]PEJ28308.1 hypothetical protein CN689_22395 [Peribacillus butanolivorans]USK35824.1 hypothetical protein LIT25_11265 [Bacillus sp. F19]